MAKSRKRSNGARRKRNHASVLKKSATDTVQLVENSPSTTAPSSVPVSESSSEKQTSSASASANQKPVSTMVSVLPPATEDPGWVKRATDTLLTTQSDVANGFRENIDQVCLGFLLVFLVFCGVALSSLG